MKCNQCRFWFGGSGPDEPFEVAGECRRYAPRPILVPSDDPALDNRDAVWPQTYGTLFCGEFSPRLEKRVGFV